MTGKRTDAASSFGSALTKARPDLTKNSLEGNPAEKGKRRFRDAFYLATDRIRIDADQVRQEGKDANDPETQALAESIREQGLQQLIVVRYLSGDDVYEVVSGERRFVAMTELLGWDEIPVRLLDVPEAEVMWFQLHENLLRKALSPRDLAASIQKAKSGGMSLKEIAAKLKKSETWVQKSLTIAEKLADDALQELQTSPQGESLEVMYAVATAPREVQQQVAAEVKSRKLGKRETQQLVSEFKNREPDAARRGRRTTEKPFEKTINVSGGITITIRARRSGVADGEVENALVEALAMSRSSTGKSK